MDDIIVRGGIRLDDCIFCKIAHGEIPVGLVYEDELVVAFRDINPQAPVHILIIPRQHVTSVLDLDEGQGALSARIMSVAAKLAMAEGLAEKGFRLVSNSGPDAGQSVHHLHFHLLGGRSMNWPPG